MDHHTRNNHNRASRELLELLHQHQQQDGYTDDDYDGTITTTTDDDNDGIGGGGGSSSRAICCCFECANVAMQSLWTAMAFLDPPTNDDAALSSLQQQQQQQPLVDPRTGALTFSTTASSSNNDSNNSSNSDDDNLRIRTLTGTLALYYTALHRILERENARTGTSGTAITMLQNNQQFLMALLAICSELMLKVHACCSSSGALRFPYILTLFQLDASHFLHVSEAFVRVMSTTTTTMSVSCVTAAVAAIIPSLPLVIRVHLSKCDEMILESYGWCSAAAGGVLASNIAAMQSCSSSQLSSSSSFSSSSSPSSVVREWPPSCLLSSSKGEQEDHEATTTTTTAARSSKRSCINNIHTADDDDDIIHTGKCTSTAADALLNLQNFNGGPSSSSSSGQDQQQRSHVSASAVSFFFKKLLYLASKRLYFLCEKLEIMAVSGQVWSIFKICLANHVELFYDRHMDQILLCTVYGVCKTLLLKSAMTATATVPEITFMKIIQVYQSLASSANVAKDRQRVVRDVNLGDSDSVGIFDAGVVGEGNNNKRGNIIQLYNEVYVPVLKTWLVQLSKSKHYSDNGRACTQRVGGKRSRSLHVSSSGAGDSDGNNDGDDSQPRLPYPHMNYTSQIPGTKIRVTFISRQKKKNGHKDHQRNLKPHTRALYSFGDPGTEVGYFQSTNCNCRFVSVVLIPPCKL